MGLAPTSSYGRLAVGPLPFFRLSPRRLPVPYFYRATLIYYAFYSQNTHSYCTVLSPGCSTSGADKTATKRSLRAKRELRPAAAAAHLQSTDGTVFRDMVTTRGRVPAMSASSGGQVLKQESRPQRRHSDTAWMVLTKLRVNLGLAIATMAE